MSRFLHHEPCPECNSRNNVAVYDDGHKWCFGCGWHEQGTISLNRVFNSFKPDNSSPSTYPIDAQELMPVKPLKWLLKNHLTNEMIQKYVIQWSPQREMLVWLVYNPYGEMLAWQGRCFSPEAKTKYFIAGDIHKDVCILGKGNSGTLVLVEDYISAIRVSDHYPCMPLFGSNCSTNVLESISRSFNKVVVWLDSDKLDNARKIAQKASMVGLDARVCYTPKDPKEYPSETIKNYLEVFNEAL